MNRVWRIESSADDLVEGLFGQVFLWVFEVLPWLDRHGVRPSWCIRSRLYSEAPDYQVIPGVLDVAADGAAPAEPVRGVSLLLLRTWAVEHLGNDWQGLHRLWSRHFIVPPRIEAAADALDLGAHAVGVHYRGTDKNAASQDTNPVSHEDMLLLLADFLHRRPDVDTLFVATDEHAFAEAVRQRFATLRVLNLGPVPFHKDGGGALARAERALLDCVLLSRCAAVLKCSSALSGFAKVLNPDLEIYRVAASKQFMDVPYFPDAYIPPLRSEDPACRRVLERLMDGDWLAGSSGPDGALSRFVSRRRYGQIDRALNLLKYLLSWLRGATRKA